MRNHWRRALLLAAAAAFAAGWAGCASSDPGGPGNGGGNGADATVSATDGLVFQPASVTIQVGQTIRWQRTGVLTHTVTFDPSRAIDPDKVELPAGVQPFFGNLTQTYSHTFNTAGQYRYVCEPHELNGMQGSVTVNP